MGVRSDGRVGAVTLSFIALCLVIFLILWFALIKLFDWIMEKLK